jgi:signal transduction histidine kinase
VSTLLLNAFDGVQIGYSDFRPLASLGSDGRLWFVNGSIVQMLDPDHLHINTFPPPVHIEQLIADHKNVAITSAIHLLPLTRDIEIDYTALSFVMPQRVRFRYKLEGHDTEWQDGGARRSAFYTNLQPGTYRFLVTACNNSGVWNSQGAALSFTILPAWYQTIWFSLFTLLALALLCYALYRQRMRQYVATMRARFNERLDERTQIARNLHDTLLQTIQGSKMVADQARNDLSDPRKTEKYLNHLSEWLDRASLEGRAALESLRIGNSGTVDLAESIQRGIEEWRTKCEIAISFKVKGAPCKIHPVVRQEIFMIAYEAIGNACRHSGGQTVTAQLSYENGVGLSVGDDGHGIDEQTLKSGKAGRFGLTGMRERAQRIHATLNILSSPGKGTKVALIVPGKMIFESSRRPGDSLFRKLKNPNRWSHPQHVRPIEDESEA